MIASQRRGGVILALDHHGGEQRSPRVRLTRAKSELTWLHKCIWRRHGETPIEISPLQDDESREKLLRARHLNVAIGVLLVKRETGAGVDHDGRARMDERCVGWPDLPCAGRGIGNRGTPNLR